MIKHGAAVRFLVFAALWLDCELFDDVDFDRFFEPLRRVSRERPRLLSPAAGVAGASACENSQLLPFLHFPLWLKWHGLAERGLPDDVLGDLLRPLPFPRPFPLGLVPRLLGGWA